MTASPTWSHWQNPDHRIIRQLDENRRAEIRKKCASLIEHNNPFEDPNRHLEIYQQIVELELSSSYEIHCQVAKESGYEITAEFLRTIYEHRLLPILEETKFEMEKVRRVSAGWLNGPGQSFLRPAEYQALLEASAILLKQVKDPWEQRISKEANELEYAKT